MVSMRAKCVKCVCLAYTKGEWENSWKRLAPNDVGQTCGARLIAKLSADRKIEPKSLSDEGNIIMILQDVAVKTRYAYYENNIIKLKERFPENKRMVFDDDDVVVVECFGSHNVLRLPAGVLGVVKSGLKGGACAVFAKRQNARVEHVRRTMYVFVCVCIFVCRQLAHVERSDCEMRIRKRALAGPFCNTEANQFKRMLFGVVRSMVQQP